MAESYHTNLQKIAASLLKQLEVNVTLPVLKLAENIPNNNITNNCFLFTCDKTGRSILYLHLIKYYI